MSMKAGHSCTHAMQVVQAQSSSGLINWPWIGPGSSPCMWRLSFTMIDLGESAVPARYAGHAAWQRPHSTHASKSSRRFQENSSSVETPRLSASSMFSMGRSAPPAPAHPEPAHAPREQPAHRRPRRPVGLHDGQARGLHHEPAHVDHEQQRQHPREARRRVHAVRPEHEPAPHGHAEAEHEEEAEEVEDGLVGEVEVAREELVPEQRQRDVPVDRGEHGAHEQGEEAPEHDRVHHAGVGLREHADLPERVREDEAEPRGDPVEALLGLAAAPEAHALGEPPREDRERDEPAHVECDLRPAGHVPERVAERDAGTHSGLNLSTGRSACAAVYGSSVPSTTRAKAPPSSPARAARSTSMRNSSTSRLLTSARRRARRRAAKAPVASRAARWRRSSTSSASTPTSFCAYAESTGISQAMSLGEVALAACRCAANFSSAMRAGAPGRSALLTRKTSAASISPAFIVWMASPDSGTRTTTVVSASFMMSSSVWPTPTVSIRIHCRPNAARSLSTSPVARASPPSEPRVAMLRMNTPGSSAWDCMRMRSPSTAPPVNGLDGPTAPTPTVAPSARRRAVSRSTTVDLPAPGGPVTPTT